MPGDLCEELIGEIFQRLPPKSLLRFRSLSKSWYSWIDSPDFIRMHALRAVKTQQKILIRHQNNYIQQDLYTLHSEGQLPLCERISGYKDITGVEFPGDIVGSCNGMLCLLDSEKGITLWNPSIRHKLTLVEPPPRFQDRIEGTHVGVGFGYDPHSDDYKVVRISYFKHVESVRSGSPLVYSMKTGAWSAIGSPTTPFYKVKSPAFSINGALHWLVKSYTHKARKDTTDVYLSDNDMCDDDVSDDNQSRRYIMTFDLSSQVFGTVELPDPGCGVTRQLTIIKGSLAVISSEGDKMYIWARDNTSCWSLAFRFESEGRVERVFQLMNNDKLLLNTFHDGLKVYNALSGECSRLLAELRSCSYKVDVETYVESLELLDKGIACRLKQRSPKRKRSTHQISDDVMHEEVEAVFGDQIDIFGAQRTGDDAQGASEDDVEFRKRSRVESRRQLAELSYKILCNCT